MRVQREKYEAQLALAKQDIAEIESEAEIRQKLKSERDAIRWQAREKLRKLREECNEGANKMAEGILEGVYLF